MCLVSVANSLVIWLPNHYDPLWTLSLPECSSLFYLDCFPYQFLMPDYAHRCRTITLIMCNSPNQFLATWWGMYIRIGAQRLEWCRMVLNGHNGVEWA